MSPLAFIALHHIDLDISLGIDPQPKNDHSVPRVILMKVELPSFGRIGGLAFICEDLAISANLRLACVAEHQMESTYISDSHAKSSSLKCVAAFSLTYSFNPSLSSSTASSSGSESVIDQDS